MPKHGAPRVAAVLFQVLPVLLLMMLSLLTVIWWAPGFPVPQQDSAWVLALNQAVADRLAFGRDVIFNLGPWGTVYAGQFHPATDGMMLGGGAIVALALAMGLTVLARGGRRWLVLLVPLLVATIGLHDPVFLAIPLLLLAVSVAVAQPAQFPSAIPCNPWSVAALLLLVASCALLTFVKSTFGTQAVLMVTFALLALAFGRLFRLASLAFAVYVACLAGSWLLAGQRVAALPGFIRTVPLVISGYTEGGATSGTWTDIAAYFWGVLVLLWLVWHDRMRRRWEGNLLLLLGFLFTMFVAFKAGFVRHDEHALIALGTLAIAPLVLVNTLRSRSLALAVLVNLSALTYVSHHYAGYEWPSYARGRTRLAAAAAAAWARLAEPGQLAGQFDAYMAGLRKVMPLPHVAGSIDIYSSGQAILLANGLDWSPRPALQSVTVFSGAMSKADLDHLEGVNSTHPPVQNVLYRVEDEDNRLRSTQDGLSWPALLTEFRVESYDRALDVALLHRQPSMPATNLSGAKLLSGRFRLGREVAVPAAPEGMAWATLDIQPTLAGRIVAFLFRPPVLSITIRYANGPLEHFRLLSSLARAGFILTPRVLDTEDMLWMLLPERRDPFYRPVSIAITGESGTRWLWQQSFDLTLQDAGIPTQTQVRPMLLGEPLLQPTQLAEKRKLDVADACSIDFIDGRSLSNTPLEVRGSTRVSGWSIISLGKGEIPDRVFVHLTDSVGRSWELAAQHRPQRPDVAGHFANSTLTGSGFDAALDVSSLAGTYTLTLEAERGGRRWRCKSSQDLSIKSP